MSRLDQLEAESISILREAVSAVPNCAMLWSIGKDSTVLLWLAKKAFFGKVPFPIIHIDTSFKIPEMIQFRDKRVREWGLDLIVGKNESALTAGETFPAGKLNRVQCCAKLKTEPLLNVVNGIGPRYRWDHSQSALVPFTEPRRFNAIFLGIRCDEEGTRSKERVFSLRQADGSWALREQPPEFWGYFNVQPPAAGHVRVHPILDWTELEIWEYIEREQLEVTSLYFERGDGTRYRSLGCACCTDPIRSSSKNVTEIVHELKDGPLKGVPERAGRAQDRDDQGGGLETLRRKGYM